MKMFQKMSWSWYRQGREGLQAGGEAGCFLGGLKKTTAGAAQESNDPQQEFIEGVIAIS